MKIVSINSTLGRHHFGQEELFAALREHWGSRIFNWNRLESLFTNVQVGGRNLALPLDRYRQLASWGEANDAWIEIAQDLGQESVGRALSQVELTAEQVDCLFTVTVTGIAVPSLDARLMNLLPFRPDLKRVPIFGLGCLAGAAGIARAADYLRGFPDQVAVLLSVELCSLTLQRQDFSIPNLIATGLFGDGAAAVVMAGEDHPLPGVRVVATRSSFYGNTERVMGWDMGGDGFKIVLSAEVPDMVRHHLGRDVDGFLRDQGLERGDISRWIAHPGGPKVLEAMEATLNLSSKDLERTWESLHKVGNLSSTSVLMILADHLEDPPPPGSRGLIIAMGPGFCAELVLVQWD